MKKSPETLAYFALLLLTLIIGLSFIFVKIALDSAQPMDLLAHRFNFATIALIILLASGLVKLPKIKMQHCFYLLTIAIFYPSLFFALQTFGLVYTTASQAGIIFACVPILTMIFASIFLKERSNIWQKICVCISVFGLIFIIYMNGIEFNNKQIIGTVLVFLSALSIVIYYLLARKISIYYSPMQITTIMTIMACLVFNILAAYDHLQTGSFADYFSPLTHSSFVWSIFYLGVLSSLLTSFLSNYALSIIPAAKASVVSNLSPIITVVAGIVFLGETLHYYHFIGAAMVIIGIYGSIYFKQK